MFSFQALLSKLALPYYLFTLKSNDGYRFLPKHLTLGQQYHFLNMGYWKGHADYDTATKTLALKLAELAELKTTDVVLAVGCGFGDEVLLWYKTYQPQYLIGLNLCLPQLVTITAKANANTSFIQADATQLPFPTHTFDKILALESAFHFNSRIVFLQEAFKTLKAQGILCLADIIIKPDEYNFIQKVLIKVACRVAKIPLANRYGKEVYFSSLRDIGFEVLSYQDVSKKVLNGFLIFLIRKYKSKQAVPPLLKVLGGFNFILKWVFPHQLPIAYLLIKAQKPTAFSHGL